MGHVHVLHRHMPDSPHTSPNDCMCHPPLLLRPRVLCVGPPMPKHGPFRITRVHGSPPLHDWSIISCYFVSLRPHVLPPLVSQIFLYCTCFHNNKSLFSYIRLARQLVLSLARILLCLLYLSSPLCAPKSRGLVSLIVSSLLLSSSP